MIEYCEGNMFEDDSKIYVVAVNCVGVMGAGQALQAKKLFPDFSKAYMELCGEGRLKPGVLLVFRDGDKFVVAFPTKRHWKQPSSLDYIRLGMERMVQDVYRLSRAMTISFPQLGCGLGGLRWEDVRNIISNHSEDYPGVVRLYGPAPKTTSGLEDTIQVVNIKSFNAPHVYVGRKTNNRKGSVLGNPFRIGVDGSREEVINLYREWLKEKVETDIEIGNEVKKLRELALKHKAEGTRLNLGCVCAPNACHADVIKEVIIEGDQKADNGGEQ